jgi:hypothetical protein
MDDPASKQAFSQARSNLSYSCFQELNDLALQTLYQEDKAGIWKERRIIAADGSNLRLPASKGSCDQINAGKQIIAEKSDHRVPLNQPQIIVDSVRSKK